MEDKNIEKNKSRLKIYYSLLITIICIIGVSFAWFRLYLSQSENNTLASRTCFSTTLTEETSKIALTDEFPIVDAKGLKKTPFTFTVKNNCSGYVKMYITIDSTYRTSTSSSYLKDNYIKVNLSPKGTTDNKSVILGEQSLTDLDNNSKGYILLSTGLKANEEKSYDLRIWMDEAVTAEQGLNKAWSGKIVVVTSAAELPAAPNGWYDAKRGTLLASLRESNELKTTLTMPGRDVSAHISNDVAGTSTTSLSSTYQSYYFTYGTGYESNGKMFNLTGAAVTSDTYANSYTDLIGKYLVSYNAANNSSSTAGEMKTITKLSSVYYVVDATASSYTYKKITSNKNISEAILASTEDDYGTSYYFRGAVKNNYVQFANKCWRIVRVNGDGSVKLVLHNDNTSSSSSPCAASNNSTTAAFARYSGSSYTSTFNDNSGDNAYIGFMYGTAGASDYASAHANTNKSTILTNLEAWYTNNLTSYESKLADTIWCNDKSTFTTFTSRTTYGSGLGYGTNQTGYGTYNRIYGGNAELYASPSLICPNDNNGGKLSKFTVDDTTNGNGNLTYKIGLLTADEIAFAGSIYGPNNNSTYLYENTSGCWWTLSPIDFYRNYARVWYTISGGLGVDVVGSVSAQDVLGEVSLRPAISLVPNITISGGYGTSEDPYVIN